MAPTVIPFSVRRWLAVFLASAVLAAAGVAILVSGDRWFAGWATIAFFGFSALVAVWQLIRRRPDLVISGEGLVLPGRALTRWADVESVGARTVEGRRREVLLIQLRDPDAVPLVINAATAKYALSRILGLMLQHNPDLEITAHPAPPKGGGPPARLAKSLVANRRKVILHAIGWPVAIVATFAVMTWWANHTGHISTARVGKCIAVDGTGYKVVGCDRPEAAYRVSLQYTKQTEHDYATRRYCPDSDMQYYYAKQGRGVVWCFTPLPGGN